MTIAVALARVVVVVVIMVFRMNRRRTRRSFVVGVVWKVEEEEKRSFCRRFSCRFCRRFAIAVGDDGIVVNVDVFEDCDIRQYVQASMIDCYVQNG